MHDISDFPLIVNVKSGVVHASRRLVSINSPPTVLTACKLFFDPACYPELAALYVMGIDGTWRNVTCKDCQYAAHRGVWGGRLNAARKMQRLRSGKRRR